MKKITLLLLSLVSLTAFAQSGKVQGSVKEKSGDEFMPIPFANVFIKGTTNGTTTDFDGNFSINVPTGEHKLVVSFVGYVTDTIDFNINSTDVPTVLNVVLKSDSEVLDEFEVVAKQSRESEQILLMQQKESTTIQQSIGAKELSNKGASDVSEGVTKITGISKSNSNSLFVRGMGDRYNNATINGLPVPSPNPDKKVIDLNIFPTDIVSNIGVSKTFTPDQYADFAGATINIVTKDYAEEPTFVVGIGTSINTQTTFKDFYTSNGDALDRVGYENGDRLIPNEVSSERIYKSGGDQTTIPFKSTLAPNQITAMPTNSINIIGGNSYNLKNDKILGFLVSASHDNKYQYKQGREGFVDNIGSSITDYNYDKYNYSTGTSGLASLYFQAHKNHEFKINTIYAQNSSNEMSFYDSQMIDRDRQGYLYSLRNTLTVNSMMSNQVIGKHKFAGNTFNLNWAAASSKAKSDLPDRYDVLFSTTDENKQEYYPEGLNASDNNRFFSSLNETENVGRADFTFNFKQDEENEKVLGSVTVGGQAKMKQRDFIWRQININIDNLSNELRTNEETVSILNPDAYINNDNLQTGKISLKEQVDPSRDHTIWQNIYSGYAVAKYDIFPEVFNVTAGVRTEMSQQTIKYKKLGDLFKGPYRNAQYDAIAVLPSLSTKYSLNEKSNLRFAASKTISRPSLKELSPFQYIEQSGVLNEGNPDLVNGTNYNADLKYEIFPNNGELIAVTIFGKYLQNPIERAQIPSSGILFSYFNMGEATVAGVEFEYQKNLGNILKSENKAVKNTSFGFNAAYLHSNINIGNNIETNKGTILATNNSRQMFGASPYIVNADLGYKFNLKEIESKWTLTYNVYGKRIFAAGTMGRGDIYEMPVNTLDLIVKNKLSEKINLNFAVKNILNPAIRMEQEVAGTKYTLNEYKRGQNISVKFVYNIL